MVQIPNTQELMTVHILGCLFSVCLFIFLVHFNTLKNEDFSPLTSWGRLGLLHSKFCSLTWSAVLVRLPLQCCITHNLQVSVSYNSDICFALMVCRWLHIELGWLSWAGLDSRLHVWSTHHHFRALAEGSIATWSVLFSCRRLIGGNQPCFLRPEPQIGASPSHPHFIGPIKSLGQAWSQ